MAGRTAKGEKQMFDKLMERFNHKSRNMGDMFERCGVDAGTMAMERMGLTLAAAARSCMRCAAESECRLWLDLHRDGEPIDPPAFCPNAGRIRQARTWP